MGTDSKTVHGSNNSEMNTASTGPWDAAVLEQLRQWDLPWADSCFKMSTNPWASGVLARKLIELICVGLSAACTNLNPEGTRHHIRAALEAGATRDEILLVLKCVTVMSIHSCSLGAPILLQEAPEGALDAAGVERAKRLKKAGDVTPAVERMKKAGQWNQAWDPFFDLSPVWTDEFMATGISIYTSGVLPAKDIELMSIAFDASFTHMYAPGTRRHIKNALTAGASVEEIFEVLKLCVAQGVQAINLGIPILEEELARTSVP